MKNKFLLELLQKYLDKNGNISSSKIEKITPKEILELEKITSFLDITKKPSIKDRLKCIKFGITEHKKCENPSCNNNVGFSKKSNEVFVKACCIQCVPFINSENKKLKFHKTLSKRKSTEELFKNLHPKNTLSIYTIKSFILKRVEHSNYVPRYYYTGKEKEILENILFLTPDITGINWANRFYDIVYGSQKCSNPECNNKSKFKNFKEGYQNTCSKKCSTLFVASKRKNNSVLKLKSLLPKNIELIEASDGLRERIEIKCKKCNNTFQLYFNNGRMNKDLNRICPYCYPSTVSKPEYEILDILKERKNKIEITPQKKIGEINKTSYKTIDIYIPKFNIGIEFNGLMFHSIGDSDYSMFDIEDTLKNRKKHLLKTEICEENGIQLFHIFENEWIDTTKKEIWMSMIFNKLNKSKRIFARKCDIKEISNIEYKTFTEENHIQGYTPAKIKIGLYYNNNLVSVMSFSKGRNTISGKYEYEMIRMCSLKGVNVVGGASRMFKYFIRNYSPKNIISFANRRWSSTLNNVYEKIGFKLSHISDPNYFYFKPGENILYSRNKFQKHKLKELLDDFDPNKTEWENMRDNGFRKIYDCGNLVYVWKHN